MRPVRLELEGFGAFREPAAVDFTDIELVALVGNTGAGKSTLIDAITFALYGSVARYDDRKVVAPVINQTATRARVRLDFELGDTPYTATRLVQRTPKGATTKEARLERAGDVLSSDAKGMTAEVTRLLGLDVDQFNRTVVLPQGRFADFLHDNPADRQATLRQLLGFDIYRHLAQAARQRAAVARNQLDALRPDLDEADAELTDERRRELVARHAKLAATRGSFLAGAEAVTTLDDELRSLDRQLAEVEAQLILLAELAAPDGLAELDQRAKETETAIERSTLELVTAQQRRREADQQAANGPDLATCRLQLRRHEEAAEALEQHTAVAAQLAAAEERHVRADRAAAEIEGEQARLDELVAAANAGERSARRAVAAGPERSRVEHDLVRRLRRVAVAESVGDAAATAAAAVAAVAPAAVAATEAEEAATDARARRDEVQQRVGVAGYAHLLTVGAPCPLCRRDVDAIPHHDLDEEVAQVSAELDTATEAAGAAARHRHELERHAADRTAESTAVERALLALDQELDGVGDVEALQAQLALADQLRESATVAQRHLEGVEALALTHRTAADRMRRLADADEARTDASRLRVLEEAQRGRSATLRDELARIPGEAELRSLVELAEVLGERQRSAIDQLHAAEQAHRSAVAERDEVATAAGAAADELHVARDRLSSMHPPPLAGERVANEWATLLAWVSERHVERRDTLARVGTEQSATASRRAAIDATIRQQVIAVLGAADGTLEDLRDRLTRGEEAAGRQIEAFDDRRARTAVLRRRVDALDSEREVADELGRLLRADGFEAWLMAAALEELAEVASARLRELSSGQFSLEIVDRELVVRDHSNADELRSAKTLSGGETFLASLALSLALADATTELSSEGAPQIESIFLDEGFGTLDPDTLDVVATTIEELGSAGRMVAVVTHLRELADRMPVRLEVSRDASGARVNRVDV